MKKIIAMDLDGTLSSDDLQIILYQTQAVLFMILNIKNVENL